MLRSHRGWDPGARSVATRLARAVEAPVFLGGATRLLVDLNRSPEHPRLFSELTRPLATVERQLIIARHYQPYREAVEAAAREGLRSAAVVHISIHSFTPVMDGRKRSTDVGLLYDPARPAERTLVNRLQPALRAQVDTGWKVYRNQPYRGVSDGFIPYLRRQLPARRYIGIEIEMNQRHLSSPVAIQRLGSVIINGFRHALGES